MKTERRYKKGISPIKILPLGFLSIILLGTALLMIPAASYEKTTLFQAFFTATSASCVTGLVVVDTGVHFTPFGQAIVLLLIQLGGLGFMTVASLLFSMMGKQISLRKRMTIAEGLGQDHLQGVIKLGLNAIKLTVSIELVGAALLAIRFIPQYGLGRGIWFSVFHSISAFCNAGFDLIGGYVSLVPYADDPLVCLTICGLIIAGGLGFAVLTNIGERRRFRDLRLHTKIVLCTTLILILAGTGLFYLFECNNPKTMESMGVPQRLLASFFQSVTCRTAGFNSIDQYGMNDASKLLSCILMFIGGSPAGTAGGIKTSTFAVLFLTMRALIRGRSDTEAFGRRLPTSSTRRSLCIFMIGLCCAVAASMVVSLAETGGNFIDHIFEILSALGTVGLSAGVTASAGTLTRLILCGLMYIGRVGMLTLALSLTRDDGSAIRYPEGNIIVG